MANNYMECSVQLPLRPDQREKAEEIVERVVEEIEKDDDCGYCGVQVHVEMAGVWFRHDDDGCTNVDHLERIARALIEELEIDEPFFASWTYSCSKPHLDEFGGGAMAIKRGMETIWVDAMTYVQKELERKEQMAAAMEAWEREKGIKGGEDG